MGKLIVQILRSAVICVGIYFAAKGMHASGFPVPDVDARAAVQAAGMAMQEQKSVPEVIAVFSDSFLNGDNSAVSVSGNADVPQE